MFTITISLCNGHFFRATEDSRSAALRAALAKARAAGWKRVAPRVFERGGYLVTFRITVS